MSWRYGLDSGIDMAIGRRATNVYVRIPNNVVRLVTEVEDEDEHHGYYSQENDEEKRQSREAQVITRPDLLIEE